MAAIPAWFWLVLAAIPVGMLAALVYYAPTPDIARWRRRWGVSRRGATVAVVTGSAAVVALGMVGTVPVSDPERFETFGYGVLLFSAPLFAGLLALSGTVGFGRRWRRLRSGARADAASRGPIVASGVVSADDAATSPVTGRDAVCWTWHVEVYDPHGVEGITNANWETMATASGGVPFAIEDSDDKVSIDPKDAQFDLRATGSVPLNAGESPPDDFGDPIRSVEADYGDQERRYHESVLALGDQVTVVAARDAHDGTMLSGRDVRLAAGTPSSVRSRYRDRAVLLLLGGVGGVWIGFWGLTLLVGVR